MPGTALEAGQSAVRRTGQDLPSQGECPSGNFPSPFRHGHRWKAASQVQTWHITLTAPLPASPFSMPIRLDKGVWMEAGKGCRNGVSLALSPSVKVGVEWGPLGALSALRVWVTGNHKGHQE